MYGHKGTVRLTFHIKGVAAHSSKPHLGQNALVAAAELIQAFQAEHDSLQADPLRASGPLGSPTLTSTLAEGGHGPNIVPQHATVTVDYRVTTSPEDPNALVIGNDQRSKCLNHACNVNGNALQATEDS